MRTMVGIEMGSALEMVVPEMVAVVAVPMVVVVVVVEEVVVAPVSAVIRPVVAVVVAPVIVVVVAVVVGDACRKREHAGHANARQKRLSHGLPLHSGQGTLF